MKTALPLLLALTLTLLQPGCRGSAPGVNNFGAYGPQRIPPPATGSIGTPVAQPANQYYPQTGSVPAAGAGWRTPSTPSNLGPNAVASRPNQWTAPTTTITTPTPTLTSGPGVLSTPSTSLAPNSAGSSATFTNPPAVTTPTISAQPNANSGASVNGAGQWRAPGTVTQASHTANVANGAVVYNQPVGGYPQPGQPVSFGQAIRNTLGLGGQPPVTSTYVHPAPGQVGQVVNSRTIAAPSSGTSTFPLRGMPVNDATSQPSAGGYPYLSPVQPQVQYQAGVNTSTGVAPAGYVTPNGQMVVPQAMTPQVMQPGTSVVPAASTQPTNVNTYPAANAGWTSAGTVRGNNDPAGLPLTFSATLEQELSVVASANSNSPPHTADRYGHHEDYRWLRGKLEYSHAEDSWKLRYIAHDALQGDVDDYGGCLKLADLPTEVDCKAGDFVLVQGELDSDSDAKSFDYNPTYRVRQLRQLD